MADRPDRDEITRAAAEVAEGMHNVAELVAPIDEHALGYRRKLERDGWSATAAEAMAVELHHQLLAQAFGGRR
ncbi:hypothetical protein [Allonocardiopsis opalescens]|uniref:Uncharacterized protein n=1 Tax=Allonocardiopsis opalescens TaxID=1144618 RepID=A0A2T0PVY4_9ACTN|nr:hypothetical protein [Allonocardiopsis opalescens]PRX95590.1 hypothetical protein CLV72_109199 [Allonocardiopsis opalescens]